MVSATADAGAKKRQKQKSQLRPKNSIDKSKTKDKKKKPKNNTTSNEKKNEFETTAAATAVGKRESVLIQRPTTSQQLSFFVDQYQSANRVQLSSLELDSLKGFPLHLKIGSKFCMCVCISAFLIVLFIYHQPSLIFADC